MSLAKSYIISILFKDNREYVDFEAKAYNIDDQINYLMMQPTIKDTQGVYHNPKRFIVIKVREVL